LTVAGKLFRRRAGQLVPFEVQCACGGSVFGERTSAAQTPICPKCRRSVFVLPASVYPAPKGPKKVKPAPPRRKLEPARRAAASALDPDLSSVAEIESGSGAEIAAPAVASTAKPRSPARQVVREAVNAGAGKLQSLGKKQTTPVRIVLASAVALALLTGWWVLHRRRLNEAERIVPVATRLGEQALEEHDLGEAARQFQKVRGALDLLGRDDAQARALRQTANEIGASANLAAVPLFDIVREAAGSEGSFSETFHSSYRGSWVVIDAPVARSADSSSGRKFDVDLPIVEGPARAVVVAELPLFEPLLPAGTEPRRVIFAAQLDDCRPDPRDEGAWRIVLRPKTAFLWSTPESLARLGVVLDDETTRVLSDQASRLGVPP